MLPLLSILVSSLLLAPLPASGQQVYRCVSSDGTSVFADRPCHFLDAAPIAPPQPVDDVGATVALERADTPFGIATEGIPAAADGCPGPDPVTLRERMAEALARRDLNALSGMYDWNGAGRREARQVLGDFQTLIASGARVPRIEAISWHWQVGDAPGSAPLPQIRVYASDTALNAQASFRLVRHAGCVWLAG